MSSNNKKSQKVTTKVVNGKEHECWMFASRKWAFTLNNYTDEHATALRKWFNNANSDGEVIQCIAYSAEVGDKCKTPHYQGLVYFKEKLSFSKFIKPALDKYKLPMHICNMKCGLQANVTYCMKDNTDSNKLVIIGRLPLDKEDKSKLGVKAQDVWKELDNDILTGMDKRSLVKKYPRLYGQYTNGFDAHLKMFESNEKFDLIKQYGSLLHWQQQLLTILDNLTEKDIDRKIIWIYEEDGDAGKSKMAKHLQAQKGFLFIENAKSSDIAYAWNGEPVVMDFPRTKDDIINWSIIESLKNGAVFSPKFSSGSKIYKSQPLICFSNSLPDVYKNGKLTMSKDRWMIYRISKVNKVHQLVPVRFCDIDSNNDLFTCDRSLELGIIHDQYLKKCLPGAQSVHDTESDTDDEDSNNSKELKINLPRKSLFKENNYSSASLSSLNSSLIHQAIMLVNGSKYHLIDYNQDNVPSYFNGIRRYKKKSLYYLDSHQYIFIKYLDGHKDCIIDPQYVHYMFMNCVEIILQQPLIPEQFKRPIESSKMRRLITTKTSGFGNLHKIVITDN